MDLPTVIHIHTARSVFTVGERVIMATNKVEICGINTASLRVLKNSEMTELFARVKNGDEEAREELISGNLKLVLSVIKSFTNRGEDINDLFQIGCIGLIKAVDNFDSSLELCFSTYAVPMIAGELRRFLRDNSTVRISRSLRDLAYKIMQLRNINGELPPIDEMAKTLETERENIILALESMQDTVSLSEPIYNDGNDSIYLEDHLSDEKNYEEETTNRISLERALAKLNARERKILQMRFYRSKTQMEIADELGISQAQVSRLEKGALEKIRKQM